jgi:hypothetical protein
LYSQMNLLSINLIIRLQYTVLRSMYCTVQLLVGTRLGVLSGQIYSFIDGAFCSVSVSMPVCYYLALMLIPHI